MINPNEVPRNFAEGVLEILPDGHGFLRSAKFNYLPARDDIYVSPLQITTFTLKTGDTISGQVNPPLKRGGYFTLVHIEAVNSESPHPRDRRREFQELRRLEPCERLKLETTRENLCGRVLDLMTPVGKGHLCLISGPRHSGKKLLLESTINSIAINHPDVVVTALMLHEDPEDGAAMARCFRGQVMFATSEESPARHLQLAEMVIEKAKRLVEQKRDVVILLDSITHLASAFNAVVPPSGEGLCAGMENRALKRARQILGAAGNMEGGGSLTIFATIEVENAKSAEQALWMEFNDMADAQIVLDHKVLDQGIFPPVDIHRSVTRRAEKLVRKEDLSRIYVLRRVLQPLSAAQAVKMLGGKMLLTVNNAELLGNMSAL
jgi:transcription termination factor Rho